MKKTALFLVSVMLITLFYGCGRISSDPVAALKEAYSISAKATASRPLSELAAKAAKGGSSELSLNLNSLLSAIPQSELSGAISIPMSLNLKTYSATGSAVVNAALSVSGGEILGASVFSKGTELSLSSPVFLGDTVLGTQLEGFSDRLDGSALAEMLGEENVAAIRELVSTASASKVSVPTDAVEHLYSIIVEQLFANGTHVITKESVTVNGETVSAAVYTVTYDAASFSSFVEGVWQDVRKDTVLVPVLDSLSLLSNESTAEIDTIIANLRDSSENDLSTLAVRVILNSKKKNLVGADIKITENDGNIREITLRTTPVPGSNGYFEFTHKDSTQTQSLIYRVTEDSAAAFKAEAALTADGAEYARLDVTRDKATGKFSVKAVVPEELDLLLEGTLTYDKKTLNASIDRLTVTSDDMNLDLSSPLTIKLNTTDDMPEFPAYSEITSMTNEEFEAVSGKLASSLMQIYFLLPPQLSELLGGFIAN